MTVRLHPSPTIPKVDIKTFPSPPPITERTGAYIEECVYGNRGQVYKPGPDLHKTSQPSEGKE
jgi:hypothetical protein